MAGVHWTDDTDGAARIFFGTLTDREIRRRQDLCAQQIVLAYRQNNVDALSDLRRMETALTNEMLRRLQDSDVVKT